MVVSTTEDTVTYRVKSDPGPFVGSAQIVRLTIKDPLDLRDGGLEAGIAPPDSINDWRTQLDEAVRNQLEAGDDVWARLFGEVTFGGGATLSIDPIPDTVLMFNVDFLLDTDFRILLNGKMSLFDGLVEFPTRLYADLSDLCSGSGRFLYLQTQPEIPVFEPLLVYRGAVAFEALTNDEDVVIGFRINLEGGVDLNIPGFNADLEAITVTTLTLEGEVAIEFRVPGPSVPEDLQIELSFTAALSETHVGDIASAVGRFIVTVDVGDKLLDPADDSIVIYGAARLTTELDFLENVGLFMEASGFLRINSSNQDTSITLPQPDGLKVNLPAASFALRLDGSVDFRIDFNGNGVFDPSESAFEMSGAFVLEFSTDGFNAAVFREVKGNVQAATLRLGPKGSPFIEFNVFAFLAIRSNGIAADLVMTADASLPLNLASIEAAAVFIVNTTGHDVTFEIPGDGTDPNRPTGLLLTVPGAAPANPSTILAGPGPSGQPGLSLDDLVNGNNSWQRGTAGAYGVVFLDGSLDLLSVLEFDVSGFVLLSKDVLSLEMNFFAGGNFLNLARASASGSVFFSSEGEFQVEVFGRVQLMILPVFRTSV